MKNSEERGTLNGTHTCAFHGRDDLFESYVTKLLINRQHCLRFTNILAEEIAFILQYIFNFALAMYCRQDHWYWFHCLYSCMSGLLDLNFLYCSFSGNSISSKGKWQGGLM